MFNAKLYQRHINVAIETTRQIYEEHGKHLKWKEPETIFEIGIGDGTITNEVILPFIPNTIEEYIGSDISDDMLKSAAILIKHPSFKTLNLDITTKKVPANLMNKFSHIFANNSLHTLGDIRQTATNIFNMLQPGGQFFFNVFEYNPVNDGYVKMDQTKWVKYCNSKSLSPFHDSNDVKGEYTKLFKQVGFKDSHIYDNPSEFFFSEEAVNDMLEAVNLRLPFVDEKDRKEYTKDFVNFTKQTKYIHFVPDVNQFVIRTNMMTGIATKSL